MPTYIREETEGSAAKTTRLPVSGKDEAGNARAIPVASEADLALSAAGHPVVLTRELDRLTDYSMIMFHTARLIKMAPTTLSDVESFPHTLTENMEGTQVSVATLPNGGPVNAIGQVFRASIDNVDHVVLTLGVSGAGIGLFTDDFESYADDTALQASWVPSDATNTNVTLYTLSPHEGSQSMRINITKNMSAADTVTRTFVAQDWSNMDVIRFWARSDQLGDRVQLRIRIGDGTSSKSALVEVAAEDTWAEFSVSLSGMVNDGAFAPNMAAITTIEWEVSLDDKDAEWIVDELSVEGDAGTIRLRLFNVASANPATLGTQVGTDQTIQLNNRSSDRYFTDFGGVSVTVGNYYALVIDTASKPVDVTALGDTKAGGGFYTSGRAFTSTDGGTTLTTQADDDFAFGIYGRSDGFLLGLRVRFDDDAGGTMVTAFVEDPVTEKILHDFGHDIAVYGTDAQVWFWPAEDMLRGSGAVFIDKDNKVELQVQWTDTPAMELSLDYLFAHKPVTPWG